LVLLFPRKFRTATRTTMKVLLLANIEKA